MYTREPGDTFKFNSELRAGTIQAASDATTWQAKASMSGPLSETLRAGLSGSYLDQDSGARQRVHGRRHQRSVALQRAGQLVAAADRCAQAAPDRELTAELLDSKGGGEGDFFYGNARRAR